MRGAIALGCVLLAGCDRNAAPTPADTRAATAAPASTPAAAGAAPAPYQQMGQTSTLSGNVSPLTGTVTGFSVTITPTATIVLLAADTLFAFDRADLTPAAQAGLQRTADVVRAGAAGTVAITGHTDSKGDDAYNLALSERRAAAVAAWLKGQAGLADRPFTIVGRGEQSPVAANAMPDGSDDPEGRARNRRVEISVPR